MIDLYNMTLFNTKIWQCWVDIGLWETFLNQCTGSKTIIELGTYDGAFSIYLLLQAINRGMKFWTFDYVQRESMNTPISTLLNLNDYFIMEDIRQPRPEKLLTLLGEEQNHPLILFCDDGAKEEEFQKYVVLLRSGDHIVVHDWGTEVHMPAIAPFSHLLTPILWGECEAMQSHTRFWKLK